MTPESSQKDGLVGGMPRPYINPADFRRLDSQFVLYSTAFVLEKADKIHDLPLNIILIGDNWVQFTSLTKEEPLQRGVTKFRREVWGITGRERKAGLRSLAQQMHVGWEKRILDNPTPTQRLTVVDFTSVVNPINLEELEQIEETTWGLRGNVKDWGTQIYLFTNQK